MLISNSISRNQKLTRKNNNFTEFKVHLIHRKQDPLLHYTVMILCYEGDGLVGVLQTTLVYDKTSHQQNPASFALIYSCRQLTIRNPDSTANQTAY